jgi:hypothetical protein
MDLILDIYNYFATDPTRLLQLILIPLVGGVVRWCWNHITNRPRICVRIIEERSPMAYRQLLKFEIENRGPIPTSLNPKVIVSGYDPKGIKRRFQFDLGAKEIYGQEPQDRALPPSVPKKFSAIAEDIDSVYDYIIFKNFRFVPTKGKVLRIRMRYRDRSSFFRFCLSLIVYKVFNKTPWL